MIVAAWSVAGAASKTKQIPVVQIMMLKADDDDADPHDNLIALCSKGWHLKKSYHEMFNFENWFLCQFSSNIALVPALSSDITNEH